MGIQATILKMFISNMRYDPQFVANWIDTLDNPNMFVFFTQMSSNVKTVGDANICAIYYMYGML